mmetsp:Transcript_33342/g.61131  ORF Transcript_33342/g.61131 Transcript_33342/m.61131 type:complete len:254 (-) Transcript_33342:427-1188(-)
MSLAAANRPTRLALQSFFFGASRLGSAAGGVIRATFSGGCCGFEGSASESEPPDPNAEEDDEYDSLSDSELSTCFSPSFAAVLLEVAPEELVAATAPSPSLLLARALLLAPFDAGADGLSATFSLGCRDLLLLVSVAGLRAASALTTGSSPSGNTLSSSCKIATRIPSICLNSVLFSLSLPFSPAASSPLPVLKHTCQLYGYGSRGSNGGVISSTSFTFAYIFLLPKSAPMTHLQLFLELLPLLLELLLEVLL